MAQQKRPRRTTITVPANLSQSIHGKMCESRQHFAGQLATFELIQRIFSLSNLHRKTHLLPSFVIYLSFRQSCCRQCGENQIIYNRKEERTTELFADTHTQHTFRKNVVSAALADHFHTPHMFLSIVFFFPIFFFFLSSSFICCPIALLAHGWYIASRKYSNYIINSLTRRNIVRPLATLRFTIHRRQRSCLVSTFDEHPH